MTKSVSMNTKNGRQALNERFKEVFKLLEASGQIVRNDRQLGFSAVAEKILGDRRYGNLINKFLANKRFITFEQAERFCVVFNTSTDYLFKGEGLPFLKANNHSLTSNVRMLGQERSNVLFSNIEALASSAIDINVHESTEHFSIPGLKEGDYVAFYISGNSMSPTISDGDMVICNELKGSNSIVDNQIYAIVTDHAILVKRIQKIYNKTRHLIKLKLISDNYLEHDPIILNLHQVRKILKVERKLAVL